MSFYVDNFETVYGNKGNIQGLRSKVLELAIQGKLVEQDANDEPASELVKRFKVEKDKLIKEGTIKKQKPYEEINRCDLNFELPHNWELARLYDVSIIQEGPGIRSYQYKTEGVQFLTVTNILENNIDFEKSQKYISEEEYHEKYEHFTLNRGDIVTACSGGSWGKSAIYETDYRMILNTSTLRLRFFGDLSINEYLYYFIKTDFFKKQIESQLVGMQPNFGYTHYSKAIITIPPYNEQQRIVSRIKSLMTEIDKLEEKINKKEDIMKFLPEAVVGAISKCQNGEELKEQLQFIIKNFETIFETPESMQELRNVILQLAIEGKLVEQDKNDEPASELINRIKVEKDRLVKEGKIKKEKTLPKTEENEIPFKIPESWEWVRLGHINIYINGDRSSRYPKDYDLVEDGIPFISTKNFLNGYVNLNDSNMQFISFEKFKELSSGKLEDSDLLFVLRGSVGKMAEFKADDKYITGFINAQIVISRLVSKSVLGYSKLFYKSSEYFRQMNNRSSGSAVPQLSADELSRIIIPIPPLAEQQRIVQRVESIMKLIDQMENKLKRKKVLVEKMASV